MYAVDFLQVTMTQPGETLDDIEQHYFTADERPPQLYRCFGDLEGD